MSLRVFMRPLGGLLCASVLALTQSIELARAETYSVSLLELSRQSEMNLRGVDAWDGVWFGVRRDETVQSVRLDLNLLASGAFLPELSHLNVRVNDEVLRSFPLHLAPEQTEHRIELDIPVELLKDLNHLQLQQVGHYTLGCENPFHESLWSKVQATSALEFQTVPKALPNDLSLLPAPFFDERDSRRLKVALVLPTRSQETVQAAGIVASWFGVLASYRGVDFQVLDQIPAQGAAIVIATQKELGAAVQAQGASLTMRTSERDGISKILYVSGATGPELLQAARSLAIGDAYLSGQQAGHLEPKELPRKPYDAPNWVPSDRPVKLGELTDNQDLTVHGFMPAPIRLDLRLPPDLYPWFNQTAPLALRYRPTLNHREGEAHLTVDMNYGALRRLDFNHEKENIKVLLGRDNMPLVESAIDLPTEKLATRANLGFSFNYPVPPSNECSNVAVDNIRSSIDPDSTLDISRLPHFLPMPNAGAFMGAGYPFSLMADLSQTSVVLPSGVSLTSLEVYLGLLAKIAQSTGYPATQVSVLIDPEASQLDSNKDILILTGEKKVRLLEQWQSALSRSLRHLDQSAGRNQTVISGFRSPLNRKRNVVLVLADNEQSLSQNLLPVFQDAVLEAKVQGSAVALAGGQVQATSDKTSYYTGSLGWWRGMQFFLGSRPWLLALFFIGGITLASMVVYVTLRARARRRLRT